MRQKTVELIEATLALTTYIEANQVFDRMADCGCGGVDTYRSDQFDQLLKHAIKLAGELHEAWNNSPRP